MYVIKRDGQHEQVQFDKITVRIQRLCEQEPALPEQVDPTIVAQKVIQGVFAGVNTTDLDKLAAETAAYMSTTHPGYGDLAARLAVSNLHKETLSSFLEVMRAEHAHISAKNQMPSPLISDETWQVVQKHQAQLESAIDYRRDFNYDFFGFKTLERSYLVRLDANIVERPQHMLMRVAVGVHGDDITSILKTYDYLSQGWFTHATPTLFNAGTPNPQMSSCFLLAMKDDSIEGIYETLKQTALISKSAGGIGVSIHNIRASRSYIKGTNGTSNGLVPMLRVYNDTARYVDQCFEPSTIVYTASGPKAIANVGVGDSVLTHEGAFKPVTKRVPHDLSQDLIDVTVEHALCSVRVSPEHQILVLKKHGAAGLNFDAMRDRLVSGLARPEMTDAKDLQEGDLVVFPIPDDSTVVDVEHLSEDDCRLYGHLIGGAGGIAQADAQGRSESSLSLWTNDNKKGVHYSVVVAFVQEYMAARGIQLTESRHKNRLHLSWNTNALGFKFTRAQLHDEVCGRNIDAAFLNLPRHKLMALIRGIIETCAVIAERSEEDESTPSDAVDAGHFCVELPSRQVTESLRWMLMRCGILTGGHISPQEGITILPPTGLLTIPRVAAIAAIFPTASHGECNPTHRVHNGMMYSRITSLEAHRYDGVVYDLEVADHHTYVTHMGAVHNGGGKRKGAFAIYLEPWHADIQDFLQLKRNHGKEEQRARDLFYALWIPDLFMKRVQEDGDWSLFCPAEAPGLADCWGAEFEALYTRYEKEGRQRETIKAHDLWFKILDSQIETGTPYMLYKDACNGKSNQQNLGTIKSSNLCTEIIEYTSPDEVAVCNLASLALPKYVSADRKSFDHQKLYEVVYHVTGNLNRVIDRNFYPVPEAERSNMRHRPIGLGVQGLADVFLKMRYPFESTEAAELNKAIFETIYFAALTRSKDLAKVDGPYPSYPGSPASKGILQFDMWKVTPSTRWDWAALKAEIVEFGIRNSLLVAPMPTASTAQILGNTESVEPYTTNIYTRRVLAGEFCVLNQHLMKDLMVLGLWTDDVKNHIISDGGSVQNVPEIPQDLKNLYKTVWEIKQRCLIDMAAARGAFIDQSQSFNVFIAHPTYSMLTSMHFYAWNKGLKTGMYYLRTRPAADAIKFTVDQERVKSRADAALAAESVAQVASTSVAPVANVSADGDADGEMCRMEEGCLQCGS